MITFFVLSVDMVSFLSSMPAGLAIAPPGFAMSDFLSIIWSAELFIASGFFVPSFIWVDCAKAPGANARDAIVAASNKVFFMVTLRVECNTSLLSGDPNTRASALR